MPDRVIRLAFIRGIEMTQQFTASEVRTESCKQGQLHRQPASDMLNAFADLLEAQEKAEPVAWMHFYRKKGGGTRMWFPTLEETAEPEEGYEWIETRPLSEGTTTVLAAHCCPPQPPAASVTDAMVERAQDCLHDKGKDIGYYHMRAALEAALAAAPQQAAESHKGLLIGTTPSGVPYSLHGTKESVTAVSDMLEQAEVSRQLGADQPQSAEPVAWPFVESPGEIADRLKDALENGCPLLGAVRQVFIENPPLYTHPQPAQDASKYQELLMAVEKKFPGESRHETALRYIRETELQSCEPKCDAAMAKESGND